MSKTTKKKTAPPLRFSENLNYVLGAFAIAFVAWVFTKAGESLEARIMVPVRLTGVDQSIEARVTPEQVPVVVRYTSDLQGYINSDNFALNVDLSSVRDALTVEWQSRSVSLSEDNWQANLPRQRRVQLLQIGGSNRTVQIRARWNARAASVEPAIVGQNDLPAGLQLVTPVRMTPREVWVVGNEDTLDALPVDPTTGRIKLTTQRLNIAKRTQSSLEHVPIEEPPGVDIVQPRSALAEVNIELQEIVTLREIRGVPLRFDAVASDTIALRYDETSATVTLRGPQSQLQKLGAESVEVRLVRPPEELPNTTKEVPLEATFTRSVDEAVRDKVTVQSVDPKSISIRYVQITDTGTTGAAAVRGDTSNPGE